MIQDGFAKRLTDYKSRKELTWSQIEELTGVSVRTLISISKGKCEPRQETKKCICRGLNLSPEWMDYGVVFRRNYSEHTDCKYSVRPVSESFYDALAAVLQEVNVEHLMFGVNVGKLCQELLEAKE